jgi:hypothetical protein
VGVAGDDDVDGHGEVILPEEVEGPVQCRDVRGGRGVQLVDRDEGRAALITHPQPEGVEQAVEPGVVVQLRSGRGRVDIDAEAEPATAVHRHPDGGEHGEQPAEGAAALPATRERAAERYVQRPGERRGEGVRGPGLEPRGHPAGVLGPLQEFEQEDGLADSPRAGHGPRPLALTTGDLLEDTFEAREDVVTAGEDRGWHPSARTVGIGGTAHGATVATATDIPGWRALRAA